MAKTYLGYGYTNENGVATLDFDAEDNPLPKKSYRCHSRTASVVAEASVNNIVTSSENIRFCEGYVPPTDSLTLTADKSILSYADEDSCTLTATYEGETVSGKSVVFKVGDTVLDTIQTDSEGVAEYTYNSQGVGDVTFTVECMNLQETYELEDCSRVYPNTYTSQSNLNYALPSTPFEVAFTLTRQSGVGYVRIGTDTNNCILFGQVGSDGSNGIARMNNGSYTNLIQSSIKPSVNAPISIKCQFDGTTYKYSIGDNTISYNDVGQALTTLILVYCTNNTSIKNLRIKPL